jgi:hypothetical protein
VLGHDDNLVEVFILPASPADRGEVAEDVLLVAVGRGRDEDDAGDARVEFADLRPDGRERLDERDAPLLVLAARRHGPP